MPEPARELTSWKQIAAYLGVNTRTAQKYERERSLPVRRLPGGHGRGRVSADTIALDAWRRTDVHDTACFRWPVDRDMIAEVRFLGANVRAMHIQRLQQYLELVRTALE